MLTEVTINQSQVSMFQRDNNIYQSYVENYVENAIVFHKTKFELLTEAKYQFAPVPYSMFPESLEKMVKLNLFIDSLIENGISLIPTKRSYQTTYIMEIVNN